MFQSNATVFYYFQLIGVKFWSLDHHQAIFTLCVVHIQFNGISHYIEFKVNAVAYQPFRRRCEEICTLLL